MTPTRSATSTALLALAAWLACGALAACGDDDLTPLRHPERMTVWAEFMGPDDLATYLAFAGESGLNVNVAIKQDEHDRAWLAEVCRIAETHDIALRIWPLLAMADGYWANQANVEVFIEFVDQLRRWADEV